MRVVFAFTIISPLLISGCFEDRELTPNAWETGGNGDLGSGGTAGTRGLQDARIDGSAQAEYCGNGVIEPSNGEQCDGRNLGGATCENLFGEQGRLRCSSSCLFDSSMCFSAGATDGSVRDGGTYFRDTGLVRDIGPIEDDDAGWDESERSSVSGGCVRSTNAYCERDSDCAIGGCGGEVCFNPDFGRADTPCGCQTPLTLRCGCVNGGCTWWY
ncbi:MAG: hypothetical protein JXA30_04655 [Deltaproteobacteria bacterium]|nr:hypothetical protein [Deltaproteobacteria bacterium]